jgi:hypothetical protein
LRESYYRLRSPEFLEHLDDWKDLGFRSGLPGIDS